MAEASATAAPSVEKAAQNSTSGWKSRLKTFGIIGAIVLAECVIAYMYIPESSASAVQAHEAVAQEAAEAASIAEPPPDAASIPADQVEIDLKDFRITAYQPLSSTTLRIDFHLWVTVQKDEEPDFREAFAAVEQRLREQVAIIMRSASMSDLADSGLGLIKRRILETTNKALGKPLVKSVVMTEYSWVEQ